MVSRFILHTDISLPSSYLPWYVQTLQPEEPIPDLQTNPMARPLPGVPAQIPNRLHLLYLILSRLQDETDKKFIKAVKINSSDFVQGGKYNHAVLHDVN